MPVLWGWVFCWLPSFRAAGGWSVLDVQPGHADLKTELDLIEPFLWEMDVHLAEHPTSSGPNGAKGIGELPSIPTAPAICNAIYNATGVRVYRLPVKPEEVKPC